MFHEGRILDAISFGVALMIDVPYCLMSQTEGVANVFPRAD